MDSIKAILEAKAAFENFVNRHQGTYKDIDIGKVSIALEDAFNIAVSDKQRLEANRLNYKVRVMNRAWALYCESAAGWDEIEIILEHMKFCTNLAIKFEEVSEELLK